MKHAPTLGYALYLMSYDPDKHHRRSIRLRGYDYAQPGAYFVTIATHEKQSMFGEVEDGQMRLNEAGRMIERWQAELTNKFPSVETDEYVVMPNHFHGIVVIDRAMVQDHDDQRIHPWG